MIYHTKAWCVERKKEEMGVPSGELWLDVAIDLDFVYAVKTAGGIEHQGEEEDYVAGKGVFWFKDGSSFVSNLPYEEAVRIWENSRPTSYEMGVRKPFVMGKDQPRFEMGDSREHDSSF